MKNKKQGNQDQMKIFIKKITGELEEFTLQQGIKIRDIKYRLRKREKVKKGQMKLIYNGKELDEGYKYVTEVVTSGCQIHMVIDRDAKPKQTVNYQKLAYFKRFYDVYQCLIVFFFPIWILLTIFIGYEQCTRAYLSYSRAISANDNAKSAFFYFIQGICTVIISIIISKMLHHYYYKKFKQLKSTQTVLWIAYIIKAFFGVVAMINSENEVDISSELKRTGMCISLSFYLMYILQNQEDYIGLIHKNDYRIGEIQGKCCSVFWNIFYNYLVQCLLWCGCHCLEYQYIQEEAGENNDFREVDEDDESSDDDDESSDDDYEYADDNDEQDEDEQEQVYNY